MRSSDDTQHWGNVSGTTEFIKGEDYLSLLSFIVKLDHISKALRSGGPLAASCCWLDDIFFFAVFNPSFLCLL